MKICESPFVTLFGFAAVTLAATLTVCWPGTTQAERSEPVLEYVGEGAKLGSVIFKGQLVHDSSVKSGWAVLLTADNTGEAPESCSIETDVTRAVVNPMARVGGTSTVAWKRVERVTVAAREQTTRRLALPEALGVQITAAEKAELARQKAEGSPSPVGMRPFTTFSVEFRKGNG